MAKQDWVMLRIPRSLRDQLDAYGLTLLDKLDIRQQGNHEDARSFQPPLWAVVAELLKRDKDHRKRARNSATKMTQVKFDQEGGFVIDDNEQR